MNKKLSILTLVLTLTLLSSTVFASVKNQTVDSKVAITPILVKDAKGNSINLDEMKKHMSYKINVDQQVIKNALNQFDSQKNSLITSKITLSSSSAYGAAWAYAQTYSENYNCYGYASNFLQFINPGSYSNGDLVSNPSQSAITTYFNVNNTANKVLADLSRMGRPSRIISSATGTVSSTEYRIAVKTGLHDLNNDGIYSLANGEADYHFMLQNSDGYWSEKPGSYPSQWDSTQNPSTWDWSCAGYSNFYNSSIIYIAVTK